MNKPPAKPPTLPSMAVPHASHVPATIEAVLREVRGTRAVTERNSDQLMEFNERLRTLEGDMDEMKGHVIRQSSKVNEPTPHDIAAQAAIQRVETKLDANNRYTKEIRDAVVKTTGLVGRVITHPKVVFAGKVLWGAAMAYAAAKGLKVLP